MPRKTRQESNTMRSNRSLAEPPEQVSGILIFHHRPEIDEKIRQVFRLVYEEGYTDLNVIAQVVGVSIRHVRTYLRQIRETIDLYIRTFPDEFERSDAAIANAIHRRMVLDQKLRAELRAMGGPGQSMRNKVGLYRIISENLREIENLQGLHVERHAHTDEEGNPLGLPLLVASRETLGEMLDRLDQEDAAEGAGNNDPPDVEG